MNRTSVDDDVTDGDDLSTGLGLRPESRVERRANRRKARARRGFGCFAGLISLVVVGALVAGAVIGFGKGRDAIEQMFAAPDFEGAAPARSWSRSPRARAHRRSRTRWRRRAW